MQFALFTSPVRLLARWRRCGLGCAVFLTLLLIHPVLDAGMSDQQIYAYITHGSTFRGSPAVLWIDRVDVRPPDAWVLSFLIVGLLLPCGADLHDRVANRPSIFELLFVTI
jgi:hypothetical protein